MLKQFSDYPMYKENYIRAFDRMLIERKKDGKNDEEQDGYYRWRNGRDVFNWWIGEGDVNVYGQMTIEEMLKEGDRNEG